MKLRYMAGCVIAGTLLLSSCGAVNPDRNNLVILHTNDTHSAIEPDGKGLGGIARRKVLVDSVRAGRENVMLVDAGDAVQGSLFYTLFGGEVERRLMNALGYDIQILGNHEFDKGLNTLAREWKQLKATRLSSNYDFTGTPLEGLFVPTLVKKIGGKKVGFIGVNLNPDGIVVAENYKGVKYSDAVASANEAAARLKKEGVDVVVAVTHIGYDSGEEHSDIRLARESKDIDVIIGGHSHTVIDPTGAQKDALQSRFKNADGRDVVVVQTGASGVNLGEVDINLKTKDVKARLIPVDGRLDGRVDKAYAGLITPYVHKVDSIRNLVIGETPYEYAKRSTEMVNLLSDFVMERGAEIAGGPVDLSIMNKGGMRNPLPKGRITQGTIIDIAPFDNSVVVIDVKGSDLLENFGIMAKQGGNGVSANVEVVYDPVTAEVVKATIDGKPVEKDRTYRVATIDYLAAGNDYMTPLKRGVRVASSKDVLYMALIDYIRAGKLDKGLASPDSVRRMHPAEKGGEK